MCTGYARMHARVCVCAHVRACMCAYVCIICNYIIEQHQSLQSGPVHFGQPQDTRLLATANYENPQSHKGTSM